MIRTYKLLLLVPALLFLASLGTQLLSTQKALAAAAECYDGGGLTFRKMPSCPTPGGSTSGSISYRDASGNGTTPQADKCYQRDMAAANATNQIYNEHSDCNILRAFAEEIRKTNCTESDGVWTASEGVGSFTCQCPAGTTLNVNANNRCVDQATTSTERGPANFGKSDAVPGDVCGDPEGTGATIETSINFGCRGKGNAIVDLLFAIIRFLSIGVGIVVIGSVIVAGIMYASAQGNPQQSSDAIKRITNSLIALLIFIFSYAILNWLIPAGLF